MNSATSKFAKIFGRISFPLWQRAVLFSVAYFVCAESGNFLSVPDSNYVSFWLPAGLYEVFRGEAVTNLYRVVQETVNNILKHSQASRARIVLERDVHHVRLW